MKKEKERENCPSQGGISSKINSCQGGRLKSDLTKRDDSGAARTRDISNSITPLSLLSVSKRRIKNSD